MTYRSIFLIFFISFFLCLPLEAQKKKAKAPAVPKPPAPRIVIDAGHGGKDPGAISTRSKIREKDVVLSLAKRVAAKLRKQLGAQVFLTRSQDTFVPLEGRNQFAAQKSCDVFLSLHANAAKNKKAQGLEIYYLNKATDEASRRLAARENEGAPQVQEELDAILSDLLQTAVTEESAVLARQMKKTFVKRLQKKHKIKKVEVKTALFYVLVGTKCPGLLVETGFITNASEARRLKSPAFQNDLAAALAEAVSVYLKTAERADADL